MKMNLRKTIDDLPELLKPVGLSLVAYRTREVVLERLGRYIKRNRPTSSAIVIAILRERRPWIVVVDTCHYVDYDCNTLRIYTFVGELILTIRRVVALQIRSIAAPLDWK